MNKIKREKIRLALKIISGHQHYLDIDDFNLFGWNNEKYGCYGSPTEEEVKKRAEDIIFEAITKE